MSFLDENKADIYRKLADLEQEKAELEKEVGSSMEEKLDPVGKEDDDINNDGKVDKTDKYLKNRIINTDNSTEINFTMLAMVIVQITSAIEKDIPSDISDFLVIKDI